MISRKLTRFVAAGAVAVALAIGGIAIANSGSSSSSASGTASAAMAKVIPFHRGEPTPSKVVGRVPSSFRPGAGTIVTGTAAEKAKAAALAAFPRRHRQPCCALEQRRIQRPRDRRQLAAPRVRQQRIQSHRCRVGASQRARASTSCESPERRWVALLPTRSRSNAETDGPRSTHDGASAATAARCSMQISEAAGRRSAGVAGRSTGIAAEDDGDIAWVRFPPSPLM